MIFLEAHTNIFSTELMKYGIIGVFCAIFLTAIIILVIWFKAWITEQNKLKDERIKKLEERLDHYEKNDRKEMMVLIERNNVLHERNERLWEEVKNYLIYTKNLKQ